MLHIEGIEKSYGHVKALQGISFDVKPGEIFGLIGSDGAGKTTLFRILTTLLIPDKGKATVGGLDVVEDFKQIRKGVGYMPGRFSLYQDLTVDENIDFFASVFGVKVEDNMDLIEDIYKMLRPFGKRRAGHLSGGMKQKLALCCALIHAPKMLFLDEPTTGVDPTSRAEFWTMIRTLADKGITVLASTPYMDEAERCDRIGLIQRGKLIQTGTVAELLEAYDVPLWAVYGKNKYLLLKALRAFEGIDQCYPFGEAVHINFFTEGLDNKAINPEEALRKHLEEWGIEDIQIKQKTPDVEDCYLRLTRND
ncbi:MAG: ABC transporter ATP-binding protein [Bacteroidaceae bacterium]